MVKPKKVKKILHVIGAFLPSVYYGGPLKSVFSIAEALRQLGHAVMVLTTNADGPGRTLDVEITKEVSFQGVTVRYCSRGWLEIWSWRYVVALPAYIASHDTIWISGIYSYYTLVALLSARFMKKQVVLNPHGSLMQRNRREGSILKRPWEVMCWYLAPANTSVVCLSEYERYESRPITDRFTTEIVPPQIEIPAEVCRQPDADGVFRLLCLGRIHPIKGFDILFDAIKVVILRVHLFENWQNLKVTIAGSGDEAYVAQCRKRSIELGLQGNVEFVGEVDPTEKADLFLCNDVLIAPSKTENFGYSIAEALSYGMPVITTRDTPWVRLDQLGCGLCVEYGVDSIARAIEQLMSLPLDSMGENAKLWIANEFSSECQLRGLSRVVGS